MPSLLERLRRSLAPRFALEHEIGAGGMGIVYRARDLSLERPVAIKILRPELATARAAERFRREARLLARVTHPNVVAIHEVGETDGLFYFVMDLVEGESLAERLAAGPLGPERTIALGRDLLSALAAVHAAGAVHRDVKPSNVFLPGDRVLLGDFGVSRTDETAGTDETLTRPDARPGTPGYMPPEQAMGEPVGPTTDIYAAGMLLYEAVTGRRWSVLSSPEEASWAGVPKRLARVLRRALAWSPSERWPDAESFRRSLERVRGSRALVPAVAAAALTLLAFAALIGLRTAAGHRPDTPRTDGEGVVGLELRPFRAAVPSDSALARRLEGWTYASLHGRPWLSLTPASHGFCERNPRDSVALRPPTATSPPVRAHFEVSGDLRPLDAADSVAVKLTMTDAIRGQPMPRAEVRGSRADVEGLSWRIFLEILTAFRPDLAKSGLEALARHAPAARENYLLGEQKLLCGSWGDAATFFGRAFGEDSTFALAGWRLSLAERWRQRGQRVDLARLYRELYGDGERPDRPRSRELSPLDSALLAAEVRPDPGDRLAGFREVVLRHPDDAYARFYYGDELFNRGPLYGIAPESTDAVLRGAVARDSFLSLASVQLAQLSIRLGDREETRRAVELLRRHSAPRQQDEEDPYVPGMLRQAYLERFAPDSARQARDAVFGPPAGADPAPLAYASRWALYLGLPGTQIELSRRLERARGADRRLRVSGLVGEGLALAYVARVRESLARFDSAAELAAAAPSLDEAAELRLEAATWRVLPPALGLYPAPPGEGERGRALLRRLFRELRHDPELRGRAAWALALDAWSAGDGPALAAWTDSAASIGPGAGAGRARTLLDALPAAADDPEAALSATASLARLDSAGRRARPFERTSVHLLRGNWQRAAGDADAADASWLWYAANDIDGYPGGPAQAGEIDWVAGPYVALRRAALALEQGESGAACVELALPLRAWGRVDPELRPLRSHADSLYREARCGG